MTTAIQPIYILLIGIFFGSTMPLAGDAPFILNILSSFYIIGALPVLWLGLQGQIRAADMSCAIAFAYVIIGKFVLGLNYGVITIIPMIAMISIIYRLGTLSREGTKGETYWYPSGRILTLLLLIALLSTSTYVWLELGTHVPDEILKALVKQMAHSAVLEDQLYAKIKTLMYLYPGIASLSNLFVILLNCFAAQGILLRQGLSLRPAGQILPISLPHSYLWLLAATALFFLVYPGSLGANLLLTLSAGLFLTGLALIHELNKIYQLGRISLGVFYLLMIVFVGIPILVCLVGLLEPWARSHLKVLRKD